MAEKAIKFRLFLGGTSVKAEKYRHQANQCQKCQKFGHLTRECRSNYKCQICAEEHLTKAHKCDICEIQNNICAHSAFKCANYGENHRANSPKCEIVKKITKKYSKESSSNQKQLDNINSEIPDFQIRNIYNKKSLKENCNDWILDRILPHIKPQKYSIICGDFNAHHSWWNLDVSNPIRANELVQWLNQHQFELLNEPDIPTFYRQNMRNISIIDLAFATKALNQSKSIFWQIDENVNTESDHEVILFSIQSEGNLVENPLGRMPYNLEKEEWKDSSNQAEFQWNPAASSQVEELEKHAENLQILIQKAAEKTIPKRKASSRSKPWWNNHISELRKTLSREKNRWKKSRTKKNHKQYQQTRNYYFNKIKMAKSNY